MHHVIFIIGVSGSGKTTLGQALGRKLHFPFHDADDFHPDSNIQKMKHGIPLNDEDRRSWLHAIHNFILQHITTTNLIIACSALKEKYRQKLAQSLKEESIWIVLLTTPAVLLHRLNARKNHFMPASLLKSQMDIYEIPEYGLHLDAALPIEDQVCLIQNYLKNEK